MKKIYYIKKAYNLLSSKFENVKIWIKNKFKMTSFNKGVLFSSVFTTFIFFILYKNYEINDFSMIKSMSPYIISIIGVLLAVFMGLMGYAGFCMDSSKDKKEAYNDIESFFSFNIFLLFTLLMLFLNLHVTINVFSVSEKDLKIYFYTAVIVSNFSVIFVYVTFIDLMKGLLKGIKL